MSCRRALIIKMKTCTTKTRIMKTSFLATHFMSPVQDDLSNPMSGSILCVVEQELWSSAWFASPNWNTWLEVVLELRLRSDITWKLFIKSLIKKMPKLFKNKLTLRKKKSSNWWELARICQQTFPENRWLKWCQKYQEQILEKKLVKLMGVS